jgi:hypothetical protein
LTVVSVPIEKNILFAKENNCERIFIYIPGEPGHGD